MSQKNLPDGYSIFEKPGSMVLRNETKWITAFKTNIAGTIFFVGLFVVSGIFFSRILSQPASLYVTLAHVAVVLIIVYLVLAYGDFSRMDIILDENALKIRYGPLPRFGGKTILWSDLLELQHELERIVSHEPEVSDSDYYNVIALMKNGTKKKLFSVGDSDEALFIVQTLQDFKKTLKPIRQNFRFLEESTLKKTPGRLTVSETDNGFALVRRPRWGFIPLAVLALTGPILAFWALKTAELTQTEYYTVMTMVVMSSGFAYWLWDKSINWTRVAADGTLLTVRKWPLPVWGCRKNIPLSEIKEIRTGSYRSGMSRVYLLTAALNNGKEKKVISSDDGVETDFIKTVLERYMAAVHSGVSGCFGHHGKND